MSILIKGMEMPRRCADCPFRETRYDPGDYQYEKCKASGRIFNECRFDVNTFAERLNDCPLIEIPTPHGRLIDEGTFICRMDDSFRMAGLNGADYRKVKRWLKNARTILEAEERDDKLKR